MCNHILNFINRHKLINKFQFGFRNNHSTFMDLIILIENLVNALGDGKCASGIFLDFQKALLKERVRIPRTRRAGGAAMLWRRLPLDGVGSCRLFFTDDLHDNLSWVPASDKPHTFKACFTHSSQVFFGRPGPFMERFYVCVYIKAISPHEFIYTKLFIFYKAEVYSKEQNLQHCFFPNTLSYFIV